jgi:hypothetical protein
METDFYKGFIVFFKLYLIMIFLILASIYFFVTGYTMGLFINFIQFIFLIVINDTALRHQSLLMLSVSFVCYISLLSGMIYYLIDCKKLSPFPEKNMMRYGKC